MIEIAVQEMKENRGKQPENKKKQNVIDTISITVKGGFNIAFRVLGWEHFDILKTLFKRLNHDAGLVLTLIDELRFAPAFTQKTHLDVVLPTAISIARPRVLLDTPLLNIDNPEERKRVAPRACL